MNQKQLSMTEAAALWARMTGAPRPHRCTFIRWAVKGVRGCRLRADPIGGRWYTTEQAMEEFHRHVTATVLRDDTGPVAGGAARAAQVQRTLDALDAKIAPRRAGRPRGGAAR